MRARRYLKLLLLSKAKIKINNLIDMNALIYDEEHIAHTQVSN